MVAVQPTRGLDVGGIEAVHRVLLERRAAGVAIVLISEELDEILSLSDRVVVMYEGRIVGSFPSETADIHEIGLLMTGGRPDSRGRDARDAGDRRERDPMTLRLEPRTDAPRWFTALMTLAALAFAFVLSGFIIWLIGGDPIRSFGHIVVAAFGSVGVISDTLVKATPLILTGLACSLAFRMRLWNIGAEGQFLLGAWGASAIVLAPVLPAGTPAIVVIPVMMLAGARGRRPVGLHPGGAPGASRGQRDHHHPDAQLRRPVLGPVLGVRSVEQGRLSRRPSRSRPRRCCRA